MLARSAHAVLLALVILASTLPFLPKAFHIDDPLYLAGARQILRDPLDPLGAEVLWEKQPELLFDANFNPPLWSYLVAGVVWFTGEPHVQLNEQGRTYAARTPELALHSLESCFVGLAIVAMYLLFRQCVRWPLIATMMVALGPGMLPGQNVMLEGPEMAFWLWAVWFYLRSLRTGGYGWVFACSCCCACGVMTKYTSLLLVLVLVVHTVWCKHWRGLWVVSLPALALLAWGGHNWLVYGRLHFLVILSRIQTGQREATGIRPGETWGRLFAVCRLVGSVALLAYPVLSAVWKRQGSRTGLLLLMVSMGVGLAGERDLSARRMSVLGIELEDTLAGELLVRYSGNIHAVVFGALGAVTLGGILLTRPGGPAARGDAIGRLLWLWLAAVLAFDLLAVPFLAVRHFLPGLVPLVCLVLRQLDSSGLRRPGLVLWPAACVTVIAGLLLAKGDFDYAESSRQLALDRSAMSLELGRASGADIWFTGNWGWRYYAERVGLKPYVAGLSHPKEGDWLLVPLIQTWALPPSQHFVQVRHLKPLPPRVMLPGIWGHLADLLLNSVRSISSDTHYYSGGTLNLPWRFSRKPIDDFLVLRCVSEH